ncbi:MAG: Rrf2 family transcriptional regulator [bacterium]|nr:Rrf2 family transcriptional regulator [bacterium]
MELTRMGEYAIRGMVYLALYRDKKVVLLKDLCIAQNTPRAFMIKIFQQLSKKGLVKSVRGSKGGYVLARPASRITLREIIEGVEGPIFLNRCLIRNMGCDRSEKCPLYPVWKKAQKCLLEVFEQHNLAELADHAAKLLKNQKNLK